MTDSKKGKRAKGRPTKYTPGIARVILDRLCEGESLKSICDSPGMPKRETVHQWVVDDRDGFAAKYDHAREVQATNHAENIARLAAKAESMAHDESAVPAAIKVAVDAHKWCAERMSPRRRFAPRSEISGPDGGPVETESRVSIYLPSNGREKIPAKGVDTEGGA